QTQLDEAEAQEEILYPANQLAANDSIFIKNDDATKILVKMMDYAQSPTIVPLVHDIFWREFLGAMERAVHHKQTPEEALTQAENVIQYQLNQAIEYDAYVRKEINIEEMNKGEINN
ncbi:MAG: hypothetical protein ABI550_08805, partial [Ignavibacteriaceae bacterium]